MHIIEDNEVQNPEVRLTVHLVLEVQNPEVRLPTALFPQESLQDLVRTHLTVHWKVLVLIPPVGLNLKLRVVHLEALWILHLIPPVGLVSLPLDPQVVLPSHLEVQHIVHLMVLLIILLEVLTVLALLVLVLLVLALLVLVLLVWALLVLALLFLASLM